ncbi:MAG: hypothetical protein WCK96_19085 [Methylococcales bacterium]
MTDLTLPPRQPVTADTKDIERIYRTGLNTRDYLRLEVESMERGLKPFGLTKSVMTLYLQKKLVYVFDLPKELQVLIAEHYKKSKPP